MDTICEPFMIIDFGSRPPLPAFNPTGAAHLENYDVVYSTSAAAARADVPRVGTPGALDAYRAAYDEVGVRYAVIHAEDVETTFGIRSATRTLRRSAANTARGSSASQASIPTRASRRSRSSNMR